MLLFISGGAKNGKSYWAQCLAKAQCRKQEEDTLYYIATMISADQEDQARIARHRQEREGWGFITVEQPTHIERILENCNASGSFLLDSVTALLANEMFPSTGESDLAAGEHVISGLNMVCREVKNLVLVSDDIYSDAMIYDEYTEAYRKALAGIDKTLAALCDIVLEVVYGQAVVHKGRSLFGEFEEQAHSMPGR